MELILAVAVTAVVLVAINGVFFTALRLRDRSFEAIDRAAPVQSALSTLRRDLLGAMAPASGGILTGDFKAGNVTSTGMGQPVNLELFTTTGALKENEPWGEVQKVTYQLRTSADRSQPGRDLVRSVTRNLLATLTPVPEDQPLLSGVDSLEITCYDGSQWRSDWDTTLTDTNLPSAIRVRLRLAAPEPNNQEPRQVELLVPIVCQSYTNLTAPTGS